MPRDISAEAHGAVEPRTTQVKLGALFYAPLTLSQLANAFEQDASQGKVQPMVENCYPSLFKSKTADDANFKEVDAYMSATDGQAHLGEDALGRCGRTAKISTILTAPSLKLEDSLTNKKCLLTR